MGQLGLYLEIIPAVNPEMVTVIMAAALRSIAVVQVACEIAVVTSKLSICSLFFILLL